RSTFDSLPYGAILTDGDYNILRANTFIAELAGKPVKDLVGKKCFEIMHKKDEPVKGCPMKKTRETGKPETSEYYDDDLRKTFHYSVLPVSGEDEGSTNYVHLIGDISDTKEQEMKLKHNRDAFFNMLKDINETHKELREVHNDLIVAFANIIDAKSQWTKGHSLGVTTYAVAIAEEMNLGKDEVELLRLAALLHDIGKIGTYDVILDKPSNLTDEEYILVQQHPGKGSDILSPIKGFESLLPIIRAHHERYDGTGYPDGLKGEQIPLLARVLCVADSYDSMISDRPYRTACSKEFAISEFKRCSGSQFDSKVINVFLKLLQT
ncbi:MAG TPA: HD domain-containing protein, partial [Nitrospirae bacterium]|nr:HD domain-containing protein [Nitrospirota bacterium]